MLISVVIPASDWDARLEATLDSILAQRLDDGTSLEIAVALAGDGPGSGDLDPRVSVVENPDGSIPVGLNRAIGATTGEIVVRVDSRCILAEDHVARAVARLNDESVGCVGGAAVVLDRGFSGSSYAIAFNGGLLGPSRYRISRRSGAADTAYLGAWRRATLVAAGGFDERMKRNQDNELAERLRGRGKVVWYDADMVVGYWNDRRLIDSVRHHRDFGRWRSVQGDRGQRVVSRSQATIVAAAAVAAVLGGFGVANRRTRRVALGVVLAGHVTASVTATALAMRMRRVRPDIAGEKLHVLAPLAAPAMAGIIDVAWAWGLAEPLLRPSSRSNAEFRRPPEPDLDTR